MSSVMTYDSLVNDIEVYLDRNDAELVSMIPEFISLAEIRCAREVKNLGFRKIVTSLFSPGEYTYIKPNRWRQTVSINFGDSEAFTTTTRSASSGVRTLTLSSAHDFVAGDDVSIFNVGGTGYNGNFVLTSVTQYTVTYTSGSTTEGSTADTGGIVTAPLEERTPLLPRSYEYCNEYWPNRRDTGVPKYYADYDYNNWLIVPTPEIAAPFEITYFELPDPLSETNQQNWLTLYAKDLILYASLLETAPYLKNDERIPMWQDRYDRSAKALSMENAARKDDASIKREE